MTKITFQILVCLLISTSFQLISTSTWADPGFTHVLNNKDLNAFLPAQRELLTSAIFRIVEINLEPVTPQAYLEVLNKVPKEELTGYEYQIAKQSLAECVNSKKRECLLPSLGGFGTAFWATAPHSSKPYLWTVRHNLRQALRSTPKSSKVHFLLLNSKGEIIWDTRNSEHAVRIKFSAEANDARIQPLIKLKYNPQETLDFVAIELALPLSEKPLKMVLKDFSAPERVYKVGYPTATNTRFEFYKLNDSDGRSLYISAGWTTSPAHAWAMATGTVNAGYDRERIYYGVTSGEIINEELSAQLRTHYLNFSGEDVVSFSGSPVMNTKGEVLGIYVGSMGKHLDKQYRDFSSIGLHNNWIAQVAHAIGLSL